MEVLPSSFLFTRSGSLVSFETKAVVKLQTCLIASVQLSDAFGCAPAFSALLGLWRDTWSSWKKSPLVWTSWPWEGRKLTTGVLISLCEAHSMMNWSLGFGCFGDENVVWIQRTVYCCLRSSTLLDLRAKCRRILESETAIKVCMFSCCV